MYYVTGVTMSNNRTTAKENLAKLMASENLLVEHADVPTAAFDLMKRKLYLPNWKNISDDVYTLLISHEVGHALYTPKEEWESQIMKEKNVEFKNVVNIVEDVRIEKLIQQKYPGTIRAFRSGYDELEKSNLFGTVGRDITEYGLLDRLNIHFKVGHFGYVNVPFSDKERVWLDRVNICKTFTEVLSLAKELMEFVEKNEESQGKSKPSQNGESSEYEVTEGDEQVSAQPQEQGDKSGMYRASPNDERQNNNDNEESEESKSSSDKPQEHSRGKVIVETQRHFDKAIQDLVAKNVKSNAYVNLPNTELDKIIVPYKRVHTQIREYYSKYYPQVFDWAGKHVHTFKNNSKNVVNQMANIFEMKKKARLDIRALTSKTGTLDMNRVHSYRYNDDVFKKVTTIPQGKSHGLVMFIDLSSSMYENIAGTFEQLLNLVLFCRRVNIPFEVYGFTDTYCAREGLVSHPRKYGTLYFDDRFCLRQYFTNRMTGVEFNDALQNIMCMMQYYNRTTYTGLPTQEQLNCTPLNPAIISGISVVNAFRDKNNLDIVNTIFLTDGEDTHGLTYTDDNGNDTYVGESYWTSRYSTANQNSRNYIRDLKTRKQWLIDNSTTTLLNIMREQTGAKVIGFFLAKKRDAQGRIEQMTQDRKRSDALMDSYKKNKFAEINNVDGYDAYYIIPSGSGLNVTSDEFESEVDTNIDWQDEKQAKKIMRSVQKEFATQMSQKMVSRVLLNRFIEHIS